MLKRNGNYTHVYNSLKKARATRAQMDTAIADQIAHARSLNVDINSICMCALFAEQVNRKLYGERAPGSALNEVIQELIRDARAARAQAELKAREEAKEEERRIVIARN